MSDDGRWMQDWEKQRPELTDDVSDELVQLFDDIRLFVEQNEFCPMYHSDVHWEIPTNMQFEIPPYGIQVHIGHNRGGGSRRTLEDGTEERYEYRAELDIQVSISAKHDFHEDAQFVNLWFDGSHGAHEAKVRYAATRLRDEYLRYLRWYLRLGEIEIPVAIETARMRLHTSANNLRERLAT
jgi:hypothetical protein